MPPKQKTGMTIKPQMQRIDIRQHEKIMEGVNQQIQLKKQPAPFTDSQVQAPDFSKTDQRHMQQPPIFQHRIRDDSYQGPKMPLNAFQCYLKALGDHTTKQARIKWNTLTEEQRQKYMSMAKLDQQRFDVEMELQQLQQQQILDLTTPVATPVKANLSQLKYSPQKKVEEIKTSKEKKCVQAQLSLGENSSIRYVKQTQNIVNIEENKVMPKKYKNPFICFVQLKSPEFSKQERAASGSSALKKCSEVWKEMSDTEKQKYVDISLKDQERYNRQMDEVKLSGNFTNEEGVCSSTLPAIIKKSKSAKNSQENHPQITKVIVASSQKSRSAKPDKSNVVKKACIPFTFFMKHNVAKTMQELQITKITECAKLLGQKWQKMSAAEKQPYLEMQEADKIRNTNQTAELKQKGYFTLEDGTKSTDFKPKGIKKIGQKRTLAEMEQKELVSEVSENQEDGELGDENEDGELDSLKSQPKSQKLN